MTERLGRTTSGLVALFVVAVAAACASSTAGRWEGGPQDDAEAVAVAQADCRTAARADAERTIPDRQFGSPTPSSSQPHDMGGTWLSMMDRYSASTREQSMFQRCMTQRGFRFVPASP
jgi:hypothetical protein